jgi:hypothetical protein
MRWRCNKAPPLGLRCRNRGSSLGVWNRFLFNPITTSGVNNTSMLFFSRSIHTRRQFLLRSSVLGLSAFVPSRLNAQLKQPMNPPDDDSQLAKIPRDTLLKFNPDGSPRPFAGNTVICHLPQQARFRDVVVALGNALRSSSFGTKLAVLPSDSYHVTILGGPNDQDRCQVGRQTFRSVSRSQRATASLAKGSHDSGYTLSCRYASA